MLIQDVGGQYRKRKEEDEAHANTENSRRMGSINQNPIKGYPAAGMAPEYATK